MNDEKTVQLYDPKAPGHTRLELCANFNPLVHTRWEARPSSQTVAFHQIAIVPGISQSADTALHEAGIHSAEDLAGAAPDDVARLLVGVSVAKVKKLLAWAFALLPPTVAAVEPQDPALEALIAHRAHEDRAAGILPVDEDGEDGEETPATPGVSETPATPGPTDTTAQAGTGSAQAAT